MGWSCGRDRLDARTRKSACCECGTRHKMFHSLNASFVEVGERLGSEVMAAEANDVSRTINEMDLDAVHAREYWESFAGVTVTGLYGAIINGHLNIVRQIYKTQPELARWPKREDGPEVLRRILSPDNIQMLAFFRCKRGMRLEPRDLDEAARRGDLTRVMLIRKLKLVDSTNNALDIAAVRGDEAMLQVLVEGVDDPQYSTRAMDGASEEGFLSMVKYLHAHGARCTRRAIDLAARNGHQKVVEYVYSNRREGCSEWAIYWASACGHDSVVQYLLSRGVVCDLDKCVAVARAQGHQEIVAILESHRAVHDQSHVCRRSSRYVARSRRHVGSRFDTSHGHAVYRELQLELCPNGLPSDVQPCVPVPPGFVAALEASLSVDWSIVDGSDNGGNND